MLAEFRSRYPNGSLLSEFVTYEGGQYAIRAVVQIDGNTVATGFAADTNIETAEDRARNRALEILGISTETPSPPPNKENGKTSDRPLAEVTAPSTPAPTPQRANAVRPYESAPTDDSDLIVRSQVQLERLGWTKAQGRSYLLDKYQKASRQHLTRQELQEFVAYLESLPS